MFFTPAHLAEAAVAAVLVFVLWQKLRKRAGKLQCFILSLLMVWCAVFSTYFSSRIVPDPMERVRITATGEKNPQATVNEICLLGYNANDGWYNLSPPVEGNWAWFPGEEGADYYYAGWFPGAEGLQPENATQDIVIEILPGQNRSLVFLKNEWYGIAEVEFQGAVQRVDTFGQGETMEVSLPDSAPAYYIEAQLEQLPVALALQLVLGGILLLISLLVTEERKSGKISRHRFLFEELVKRDFTLKYKRTILGMLWSILSPLSTLLIMWIVFKDILGSNINHFAIYMFTGQMVFGFFSDATMQGMTSLLDNASIFTKVNIPKYLFLLSKNISSLINFGLTLLLLIIFILVDGLSITSMYLLLVYPICCLIVFNIGVGLILSALFVFFRDMQYLWGVFTQLIMWVSAIFYSTNGFDEGMQKMFLINPLYSFIGYFRSVILDTAVPSIETHCIILVYTLAVLAIGAFTYKKYNHEFLYYF